MENCGEPCGQPMHGLLTRLYLANRPNTTCPRRTPTVFHTSINGQLPTLPKKRPQTAGSNSLFHYKTMPFNQVVRGSNPRCLIESGKPLKLRVFGYKEVYFSIRRYSPVQGLCRLFLFISFFLFRLRVSRQMNFSHEVKDNIHFLKTLAVYLLRRMDNNFFDKFINDSGR